MFFGNRRPREMTARYRDTPVFQPHGEQLEAKILMSIDLGGTTPPALPNIATAPYGIDMVDTATTTNPGAGYSVADVGDLIGTGYDDMLIGAPGVTGSPPTTVSTSAIGTVYLVLGSQYMNSTTTNSTAVKNWLNTNSGPNLTANNRVGNLSQLGQYTTAQTNPISGTALGSYPFAGITFTGVVSLGASVAGVTLSGGRNAILIGAPNSNGGAGSAYLISGNFAQYVGQTINLASASNYSGLSIVTFTNTASYATTGELGYSVAGGSNILGDGAGDIILGAPNASVAPTNTTNPVAQNTGVVYVISANALSGGTQTINLSTLLTSQVIDFAGAASGDRAGSSVADGGNVNGASGGVDDLLIGAATAASNSGAAYLIYGGSSLAGLRTTVNGIPFISLANVNGGTSGTNTVPGAVITGPAGGDETGFSVSAGGDFNNDGYADILIGTPFFSSSTTLTDNGEATLLYGAPSTSGAYLSGSIPLASLPANIVAATFTGGDAGDLAGWSLSQVGLINAGQPTSILIGAPGYNSDTGTAYLIPGRAYFTGTYSLSTAESAPLSGLQFVGSTPVDPTADTFFGASVSSRLQGTQRNTVDTDNEADFIIGAPGYVINTTAPLTGAGMIVESGFLVVPIPTVLSVTVPIGVGTPSAPFSINATTPASLQIYVFGSTATTPPFMPVTDINQATVVVDGVAFPDATVTQDPDTSNYLHGIPDAIVTITPRSALNLVNGSQTFTITGQTLASSPLPNYTWTGTATVTVTGGTPGPPSVGAAVAPAIGPVTQTQYISPFGANQYSPSITAFSALTYQPIPLSVALNEYLPPTGFRRGSIRSTTRARRLESAAAKTRAGPAASTRSPVGSSLAGRSMPKRFTPIPTRQPRWASCQASCRPKARGRRLTTTCCIDAALRST